MNKVDEKRLTIDMDKITHSHIKKIAVDRNTSMRKWILEAIAEKIRRDLELGFK
jgi:hypothetical protein